MSSWPLQSSRMKPKEVAEAYSMITEVQLPSGGNHMALAGELVLVRAVDPMQLDLIDSLCSSNGYPNWARVRDKLWDQRKMREKLFVWINQIDEQFREQPDLFVFPDPYSLLLWIWTIQLFRDVYTRQPGFGWKKYLYRGEWKDYGKTAFQPSIERPNTSTKLRERSVPGRIRAAVLDRLRASIESKTDIDALCTIHLAETMSDAQALAVGQHY